jgi:hypothetical protein
MKSRIPKIEMVPLESLSQRKKGEARRLSFSKKLEWTTRLREYAYGKEATTGRVQRIHSVAKLGQS